MGESELLSIIEQEEANCLSTTSGKLSEQRREALQYYYGEPYGNEVEGRSQVVTTEVKDAVEGILPSLMRIFMSTDEIVRFEPQNPEDDGEAQQATDYLNYLFTRQNNGFVVLYCLFKDALLQKTGFTKVYWEDYADQGKETYENLDDMELALLMQDPELEIIEHEAVNGSPDPTTGAPAVLHNVVFRRTKKYGKVCIDPCPPEEIRISRDCRNDLNKARFRQHLVQKTISDLREMGYDVPDDLADDEAASYSLEAVERNKFDDANAYAPERGNNGDPSTNRVWYKESYFNVDFDEDGHAELRQICSVGQRILKYKDGKSANFEIDSIPIVGGTAIMMPHKFHGLSLHDLVGDIQLIKSTITRQLLDNAYIANNGTFEVLDGMVNMDDLLTRRPMGIVRTKVLGAMKRVDNPLLGQSFYGLLDYFDKVKQNRIGSTDFPNAIDPDAINAKAAFVDKFAEAAMERINLMARILAETCVKDIFWKLLELVSKHQQKPQMVKLRGNWVNVDPREWKNRFNMTVTVGLGTGSQQTVLNGAMGIMNIQSGMVKAGLMNRTLTEKNVYEAAIRYAKAVFPKDSQVFFTDPSMLPPAQPQPNPEIMKIQLAAHKAAAGNKQKYDKMMMDYTLAMKQMGIDVLAMAHDSHLTSRDMAHDHIQGSMDRATELAMHQNDINNQPAPSATQIP